MSVGPLEWHGEHLPFCTDPIRAYYVVKKVWERTGGVLLPPLHIGTDRFIEKNRRTLWGMEKYAGCRLPGSLFIPEKTMRDLVKGILLFLEREGFRLCVLCTGHEARNQIKIIDNMQKQFAPRQMKVVSWYATKAGYPSYFGNQDIYHAGTEETSELLAIDKKLVELGRAGRLPRDKKVRLIKKHLMHANPKIGGQRLQFEIETLYGIVKEQMKLLKLRLR